MASRTESTSPDTRPAAPGGARWFGHPRGLALGTRDAAAVYGIYTAMVYLLALPGGWAADRPLKSNAGGPAPQSIVPLDRGQSMD